MKRGRRAIVASRVVCRGKWKQVKERDGSRKRKEWGDTDEAGPATMTSRALKVGMTEGWVYRWDGSGLGFFLARCCLGQVPGGAPFSQRSEQATACTNRMQIRN